MRNWIMEYDIGDVVILRDDKYQLQKYRNRIGIILEVDIDFEGYRILVCGLPEVRMWFHADSINEIIYKNEK